MDNNELMVGDWVFCTYWGPARIVQIAELKTVGDDELKAVVVKDGVRLVFEGKYIEPIPLTEGIFQKNGFEEYSKEINYPFVCYYTQDKRMFVNNLTNSGDSYWHVHIDNEDFQTIGGCEVQYFHEMQHFLRLCHYEVGLKL